MFLGTKDPGDAAEVELTYNWDQDAPYPTGRFFGHLAYAVDDIYALCTHLEASESLSFDRRGMAGWPS